LFLVAECFEEGNDVVVVLGILPKEVEKDLGLAGWVVRLDVPSFDDYFESAVFGAVDLGGYARGNVRAIPVGADADAIVIVVVMLFCGVVWGGCYC